MLSGKTEAVGLLGGVGAAFRPIRACVPPLGGRWDLCDAYRAGAACGAPVVTGRSPPLKRSEAPTC